MSKNSMVFGKKIFLLVFLIITGCASLVYNTIDYQSLYGPSAPKQRLLTSEQARLYTEEHKVSFYKEVKPILDSRCVVCHGCYDAPCQLKLGSIEGLDRGASKQTVYDATRLKTAPPTRLFIDATDTEGWRKKDFFPVLNERVDSAQANLDNSILAKLIDLKRLNPQPTTGKLGKAYDLKFDRTLQCSTIDEFPKYQHQHPQWGMPYAMPGLTLKEENTLKQWLIEGSKVEPLPAMPSQTLKAVEQWETYFNGSTPRQRLVFRYIFEHLFLGHIHFKGHSDNEFFQLVRSRTATGQAINELKTALPYDDPLGSFYYRLRPITETIVDKTHFVYELSDEKMQRINELFFKPDYQVTLLPSYQPKVAANPFKTFAKLPLASKAQFLLDDAEYFVSGFIKGPVCRGQIALNSIRDRFWVVFLKPGEFYSEKTAIFLANQERTLALPGQQGNQVGLFAFTKYDDLGKKYLKEKNAFIDQVLPENKGFGLDNIWDGGGVNQNAALTVFRHLDSATVTKGFIGDTPLTAWVVDYPAFEQLHYLLVAGFNVYGSLGLQVASRTYMDILRQDAEDNFLRLMPAMERQSIYNSWYPGHDSKRIAPPQLSILHPSEVKFKTMDFKKEFFDQLRKKMGKAQGEVDTINNCGENQCIRANTTPVQQQVDNEMRKLAKLKGQELHALPDDIMLRVKTGNADGDLVYSLLVDKAFSNISTMLWQNFYREPQNDRITVYPGFVGSYPNFYFSVDKDQLGEFVESIRNARDEKDIELLYSKFGIRRTNPEIWQNADWFDQQHHKYRGLNAGLLDLSRYHNL
jgi:hypothetical protein